MATETKRPVQIVFGALADPLAKQLKAQGIFDDDVKGVAEGTHPRRGHLEQDGRALLVDTESARQDLRGTPRGVAGVLADAGVRHEV